MSINPANLGYCPIQFMLLLLHDLHKLYFQQGYKNLCLPHSYNQSIGDCSPRKVVWQEEWIVIGEMSDNVVKLVSLYGLHQLVIDTRGEHTERKSKLLVLLCFSSRPDNLNTRKESSCIWFFVHIRQICSYSLCSTQYLSTVLPFVNYSKLCIVIPANIDWPFFNPLRLLPRLVKPLSLLCSHGWLDGRGKEWNRLC